MDNATMDNGQLSITTMSFENYLQQQKLTASTVKGYSVYLQRFLNWCLAENVDSIGFTYNDILDFMRHCQSSGITKHTVQMMLGIVRHYCIFLIAAGKRTDNPAAGIFIKGLVRKLPNNLLSTEEMEVLYKNYCLQLSVSEQKKIMFGLMIYQGLTTDEIIRLQQQHIKLNEGKILVQGSSQTNERLLDLQASQMILLQAFIKQNKFKDGSLLTRELFKNVSQKNISNQVQQMFRHLKKLNPKVVNALQIRSSVITEWLRKNNLRQVQYMAGHKWVSSTERYQTNNLDDLQNELRNHHPMK